MSQYVTQPAVTLDPFLPGPVTPSGYKTVGGPVLAVPGPPGAPGADYGTAAVEAHVASTRPHQAAESGYDAAAFFNAMTV